MRKIAGDEWPAEFTVGYLARRAGMSRDTMRRRIKEIPALAALFKPGRWTKISLDDLQHCAPKMFNSILLRRAVNGGEDELDDD